MRHATNDRQAAAALFRETLGHRKTQPGTLPERLGRKERLQHANEVRLIDTGAGIGDRKPDIAPWPQVGRVIRTLPHHFDRRGQGQRAAVRHRIAPIGGQVDQRRLQLALVSQQRRQVGRQHHTDQDAAAQCMAQHVAQPRQQRLWFHRFGPQLPPARKGQQPAGDGGASFGRIKDHLGEPLDAIGIGGTREDQAGAALHGLQDVVEIVCDAARQLPQCLHPFGMSRPGLRRDQGRFGVFPFRNIGERPHDAAIPHAFRTHLQNRAIGPHTFIVVVAIRSTRAQ